MTLRNQRSTFQTIVIDVACPFSLTKIVYYFSKWSNLYAVEVNEGGGTSGCAGSQSFLTADTILNYNSSRYDQHFVISEFVKCVLPHLESYLCEMTKKKNFGQVFSDYQKRLKRLLACCPIGLSFNLSQHEHKDSFYNNFWSGTYISLRSKIRCQTRREDYRWQQRE